MKKLCRSAFPILFQNIEYEVDIFDSFKPNILKDLLTKPFEKF